MLNAKLPRPFWSSSLCSVLLLYQGTRLLRILSCSVACNKIHRETHASEPEPAPKPRSLVVPPPSATEQGHGIDNNPFHVLESSEQLQYLFKKYPRLRDQLLDIHTATMEPPSIKSKIPASLMKDLPKNSDTWDRDKGIANGKAALRKARRAAGEDGEALREYSELVKHFLDNPESVAKG